MDQSSFLSVCVTHSYSFFLFYFLPRWRVQTVKVIAENYDLPLALWGSHPRCTDMWASRQCSLTRNAISYLMFWTLGSSIPGVWYLENFCVYITVRYVRAYHSRACANPIHFLALFSRARLGLSSSPLPLCVSIRILHVCSHSRYTPRQTSLIWPLPIW
jgi:hypothetical protein